MEDLNLYPIDVDTFRDWLLAAQRPGGIAGIATDDEACPLSNFLQDLYGGSWLVHFSEYERLSDDLLYEMDARFSLPAWACSFALRVDMAADCQRLPVSFGRALVLFNQAWAAQGQEVQHG